MTQPVSVRVSEFTLELSQPLTTARGAITHGPVAHGAITHRAITHRDGLLVEVTQHGITGIGEAMPLPGWPGADLAATRRSLLAWAKEPDPNRLPDDQFAHVAVELALKDMAAQQQGLTLAEALAAALTPDGDTAPAQAVELNALVRNAPEAASAVASGYRTVKLKVGAQSLDADIAAVAEVREAIGAATRLRLDANGAWTPEQAVVALGRLEQFDIEYIEEPAPGLEALAEVARRSPIAVAADESLVPPGAPITPKTAIPHEIAVMVVKPMVLGLGSSNSCAKEWISQGRKVIVTNYLDSPIGQHAALSLAAALPGPRQVHGAVTAGLFAESPATGASATGGDGQLPPIAQGRATLPTARPTPPPAAQIS